MESRICTVIGLSLQVLSAFPPLYLVLHPDPDKHSQETGTIVQTKEKVSYREGKWLLIGLVLFLVGTLFQIVGAWSNPR